MRTTATYRHFFRGALLKVRAHQAEYDAEVAEWYSTGEGATRGYTFPACIHGMSRWTDYDNICGGCEDSLTEIQQAQAIARASFLTFNDRWEWLQKAPTDLPHDQRVALTDWVFAAFPKE